MAALAHAERRHAGQRRQADGAPFILYPLEVCCLLYDTGAPDHVIAAGVLDDTIEETDANAGLRTRFGLTIATLEAVMVFAADEIPKARELRLERGQTRQSPLPLVTQLRTASRTLPVSVIARRTSWRRTSLAQGEIRWDLVTEGIGYSSTTTASRTATVTRRASQSQVGRDG